MEKYPNILCEFKRKDKNKLIKECTKYRAIENSPCGKYIIQKQKNKAKKHNMKMTKYSKKKKLLKPNYKI